MHQFFYPAFANIRPQLEYASYAWSPWLKQDIIEIKKVQRFVHNNYWPLASVTQMLCTLDWETLETRREKTQLCMLFKIIKGSIKIPFDHYKPNTHMNTSTRFFHSTNLSIPFTRTDADNHSFFPETIHCWNYLPTQTVKSSNLHTFKTVILELV